MNAAKHTPGPWERLPEIDAETGEPTGRLDDVIYGPWYTQHFAGEDHRVRDTVCAVGFSNHQSHQANAQLIVAAPVMLEALRSARKLLERCGPHLNGVEQECCGQYEAGEGGEYMGQREMVPVCCDHPIDLSDCVANEIGVIDAAIAKATGSAA